MVEFGKFLEELRGKLSLRQASEKSGLSHTYIRDLELGVNRKNNLPIKPTAETLKRLAEAYDHSYPDLMVRAGLFTEDDFTSNKFAGIDIEDYKDPLINKKKEKLQYLMDNGGEQYNQQIKNPNPSAEEREFYEKSLDLSDSEIKEKYEFKIDGRELSQEEYNRMIAAVRADRLYNVRGQQ